ncbi:hypothetical protein [Leptospira idonii]|uniref:Uncharacterized protein n=1 Tax=Leptospira idonii TaxID=1193500 RepID=A0A4R9M0Q3_9LEPT|nr:hypothetical protein [Leptospira idonii]TGN20253.1 hypothetical protein EHS15_04775 [Leptospira idonii]
MESPNNNELRKLLSSSARMYLKALGEEDEFQIAYQLTEFEKRIKLKESETIDLEHGWKLWLEQIASIYKDPSFLTTKEWKLASMTPANIEFQSKEDVSSQTSYTKIRPLFFVLSVVFWSFVYYLLIFKFIL